MFKNAIAYRIPSGFKVTNAHLSSAVARPCGASERRTIGFAPPRPAAPDVLVHEVAGRQMIRLQSEEKILPSSVIKEAAADRAKEIEDNECRRVGRKEMRELKEALSIELLSRAFTRHKSTIGWIDPSAGWLVIDSSSPTHAEEFLEQLRKSVEEFPARIIKVAQSPSAAMTGWVAAGEAPESFTLDQDLYLRSAERAEVRYVRHTLDGDDVRQHIASGKVVTRLAMTWGERISFLLDENLLVKRLSFLDIITEQNEGQAENEEERFDLDFTLMSGEISKLLGDLVAALGGEQEGSEKRQIQDTAKEKPLEDCPVGLGARGKESPAALEEPDPLYEHAVEIVLEHRRASISLVQRHLIIGYNRSARLIEAMEKNGVVSAMDSTGVRSVLASS